MIARQRAALPGDGKNDSSSDAMTSGDLPALMRSEPLDGSYVTAGDRAYVIGSQGGGFPGAGWHDSGEMDGVWAHPIKLLDGFWLEVDDVWLTRAEHFLSGPFWAQLEYDVAPGLHVHRTQFVPDGESAVVIRFAFHSTESRQIRCRLLARTDLRPVWDPHGIPKRARDEGMYDHELQAWCCVNIAGGAAVIGTSGAPSIDHTSSSACCGPEQSSEAGLSVLLTYDLPITENRPTHLDLVVAGSVSGIDAAVDTFKRVRDAISALWNAKSSRYADMLERSAIDVPDCALQEAWGWMKCNYDWLVRDVPGLGRGLGAGLPEYPWWFGCDNAYALLGCLAFGQHEIVLSTLDLLREISIAANGTTGRVIHECTTAGTVTDAGRVNETPQFVAMVWQACLWTGDLAFLQRNYDFCKRGLLNWTIREHTLDVQGLPSGYGMIEVEGLDGQCVDVAAYTVSGLLALAAMADVVGDDETGRECRQRAIAMSARLEQAFWIEDEGLYGDVIATPREMTAVVEHWAPAAKGDARTHALSALPGEAEQDPEPERKRPCLLKNWTVVAPLEVGIASRDRASQVLDRIEGPEFVGRWGMYVNALTGGDCMSVTTGALIAAELNYGRVNSAVRLMDMVAETLTQGMPGAIAEILPDRGCFVQAWSGYAIAWPVVDKIFGLQPDAFRRRLTISPRFPDSWPRAELHHLPVGSALCDVTWDGDLLRVHVTDPVWDVVSPDESTEEGLLWKPVRVHASPDGGRFWVFRPA